MRDDDREPPGGMGQRPEEERSDALQKLETMKSQLRGRVATTDILHARDTGRRESPSSNQHCPATVSSEENP